jgi:uncharacterized membrane protein
MKSAGHYFAHNKYRLTILSLLAGASVVCVELVRLRVSLTGSTHYMFLVWNLFLAWIPSAIACLTCITSARQRWLYMIVPVSALTGLVFFPNAPYILTDLQQLNSVGGRGAGLVSGFQNTRRGC